MRTIISEYDLSLQHVTKGFEIDGQTRSILADVSYAFLPGKTYALVGASGSGKSTLLHILAGFEPVDAGTVFWGGVSLPSLGAVERDEWLAAHIGFAFQFHYLIPELSVYENVKLAALLSARASGEAKEISSLLAALGLGAYGDHYPHQLSGGQQQRATLARALIRKPTFLIADEPTGNLDGVTGGAIIDFCCDYQRSNGMGLIVATHDVALQKKMDVVLRVENGKLH